MKPKISPCGIYHPIALALFPAISLYSRNSSQCTIGVMASSLAVCALFGLLLYWAARLFLRDRHSSGIMASCFLLCFFSYGYVHRLIATFYLRIGSMEIGADKVLFSGLVFVVLTVAVVLRLTKLDLTSWTKALNAVAACLLIVAIVASFSGSRASARVPTTMSPHDTVASAKMEAGDGKPSILYMILDGYAREDVMRTKYDYDGPTLQTLLRDEGFSVVDDARSNYCQTALSLASSLNMMYLNEVAAQIERGTTDLVPLRNLIRHSRVLSVLGRCGYETIAFPSGYWPTEIETADRYLRLGPFGTEFENALLSTTPLPALFEQTPLFNPVSRHRERIHTAFSIIPGLLDVDTPVFVFAHLTSPGPPFVFAEDGSLPDNLPPYTLWDGGFTTEQYRSYYKPQFAYISRTVQGFVRQVKQRMKRPYVLVIQSDHGPRSALDHFSLANTDLEECTGNLLAIYLSDREPIPEELLTPVNVFRFVFDRYLGTHLGLIENRCYFSTWDDTYHFVDVTEKVLPPLEKQAGE
jgi:hypothetical protein